MQKISGGYNPPSCLNLMAQYFQGLLCKNAATPIAPKTQQIRIAYKNIGGSSGEGVGDGVGGSEGGGVDVEVGVGDGLGDCVGVGVGSESLGGEVRVIVSE